MQVYNSKVINDIKSVKETLTTRYSSNQLIKVLDSLIYRALEPIVEHTDLVDTFVANLMCWYVSHSRRKICYHPRLRAMYLLHLFLVSSDVKKKMRILRKLGLERNMRFLLIDLFLSRTKEYPVLEWQSVKTKDLIERSEYRHQAMLIEMQVLAKDCCVNGSSLTSVVRRAQYWSKAAHRFRNQMMEKYMRHTMMRANSFYRANSARLDLEDVVQNFILAVDKAITKFNPNKGTLTPYINTWLYHARSTTSSHGHEYGVAYSVPALVKKAMKEGQTSVVNIAQSMHDNPEVEQVDTGTTPELEVERWDTVTNIRRVARAADPKGLARMKMGIEEHLNSEEVELLRKHSVDLNLKLKTG